MRQNRLLPLVLAMAVAAVGACSKSESPAAQPPAAASTPAGSPSAAPGTPAMMSSHADPGPAMAIADVWKSRKELAGKTVTVSGKVVKYNGGIMDRNWVHVQDGTGIAAEKTNDLTVTTADDAAVGDTVTATGIVGIDKDFTAGYVYPVILENAHVVKKQ